MSNLIITPVSFDAFPASAASELEKIDGNIIIILKNDREIDDFARNLRFFVKEDVEIHSFPDFDKLPYEQTQASPKILETRIKTLHFLSQKLGKQIVIVTSLKAISRKQIPANEFAKNVFHLKENAIIDRKMLIEKLLEGGYERENMALNVGDFAVRGSILDIFPIGFEEPVRLDFAGDEIETIKFFDIKTQISFKDRSISEIKILPASEVVLNEKTRGNFLENHKMQFSVKACSSQVYESVKNGRRILAMENFLPHFYNELECLTEYLPGNLKIFTNSASLEIAHDAFLEEVNEAFKFHDSFENAGFSGEKKKFLAPNELYLSKEEFQKSILNLDVINFAAFRIEENGANFQESNFKKSPDLANLSSLHKISAFVLLKDMLPSKKKILIACRGKGSLSRISEICQTNEISSVKVNFFHEIFKLQNNQLAVAIVEIETGFEFQFNGQEILVISEKDLLGEKLASLSSIRKKKASIKRLENILNEAANFEKGDLVVHRDHGIGEFEALESLEVNGSLHDFLKISYQGNDKFYLPVENIELLTKYGAEKAELDKLGMASYQMRKARLKKKLQEIAAQLIKIAAERKLQILDPITPDLGMFNEFVQKFPYVETDDQLAAINDVLEDLEKGIIMDRLICGDVGFGKTEVAIRATFAVVRSTNLLKRQVAILAPTTLLARQHFEVFHERLAPFGIRVGMISRLVSATAINETKEKVKKGEIDVVIGTHAILSESLEFHNLSLLVIDEEQAFGVLQKEKIKQMAKQVHLLAMSATPIPRTLQMSLIGIKDLSLIATPPMDRLPIRTSVLEFDPLTVREAILREFNRGGKIFYVAPRISDLSWVTKMLEDVVPEIPFVVCHGQMKPSEIDKRTQEFENGKYSILVSTSIIESGIDIESANTMIIHRADMFGLSALYQLRGRIGRGKVRAHAYLTIKSSKLITANALKRLEILSSIEELGAGFTIASSDMDERGFGNLLGTEQAGNVKEVGAELYQKMLQDEIEKLHCQPSEIVKDQDWSPSLNLNMPILIPESYIPDLSLRLGLYRRIAFLKNREEIDAFLMEMVDRFGEVPMEMKNLLEVADLKMICRQLKIEKLDLGSKAIVLVFRSKDEFNLEGLVNLAIKMPHKFRIRQDQKFMIMGEFQGVKEIQASLQNLEKNLIK